MVKSSGWNFTLVWKGKGGERCVVIIIIWRWVWVWIISCRYFLDLCLFHEKLKPGVEERKSIATSQDVRKVRLLHFYNLINRSTRQMETITWCRWTNQTVSDLESYRVWQDTLSAARPGPEDAEDGSRFSQEWKVSCCTTEDWMETWTGGDREATGRTLTPVRLQDRTSL